MTSLRSCHSSQNLALSHRDNFVQHDLFGSSFKQKNLENAQKQAQNHQEKNRKKLGASMETVYYVIPEENWKKGVVEKNNNIPAVRKTSVSLR